MILRLFQLQIQLTETITGTWSGMYLDDTAVISISLLPLFPEAELNNSSLVSILLAVRDILLYPLVQDLLPISRELPQTLTTLTGIYHILG